MPTVFIAVQCFQCSTMQVKQRKKSSNKWTCVVCNEKQSVRKVYSQALMAKDVRKFVQSFNMSRQFVEQQQELREQQTLGHEQNENIQPSNKRTDWSEYIDDEVNDSIGDDEGELCEPNFVTELPKPLFKKPKLRNNHSADCENGEKLQRPVFVKRNTNKNLNNPGKEQGVIMKRRVGDNQHNQNETVDHCSVYGRSNSMTTNIMKQNSKWDSCDDGVGGDHGFIDAGSSSVMAKLKRPVSKWNNFIDDEESRCEETVDHDAFETKVSDEIVEDDVHPDFI